MPLSTINRSRTASSDFCPLVLCFYHNVIRMWVFGGRKRETINTENVLWHASVGITKKYKATGDILVAKETQKREKWEEVGRKERVELENAICDAHYYVKMYHRRAENILRVCIIIIILYCHQMVPTTLVAYYTMDMKSEVHVC